VKNTIPSKALADLLASFAPEVRNLALATRTFVLKTIPGITEHVDVKARIIGYGYGPRYADTVCVIMPVKTGVNLGVAYAMQLADPDELLEGAGKLHRHVKLKSNSDLERAALKALLKVANTAALARRTRDRNKEIRHE
jgi:hypothetical protein